MRYRTMKLLERADLVCRRRGMSGRTARVYCQWIGRFLRFSAEVQNQWVPPEQLGTADIEAFLNHLVGERHRREDLLLPHGRIAR